MMNFCTLYDSNYISKGLALYLSIARYTDNFKMYVMAMDRKCYIMLKDYHFDHLVVECIEENMSEDLLKAQNNRSRAEFCWTCGPYITHHFLYKYDLSSISYLDSDLMFFCDPKVIFDELRLKNASIGLSPHFVPYNATGKYCVQYCYFKNDADGRGAITWWKDECLKWCYSQIDDGKYGDQMYLEQIPKLFNNVSDIENRGTGMAYWNEYAYKISKKEVIIKGTHYPFVFFHYSGFNIKRENNILIVRECYPISKELRVYLVMPYVALIKDVYNNYLNQNIESVLYRKDYSIKSVMISLMERCFKRFDFFFKLKAYLLRKKYLKRHAPYSEK